MLLIVMSTVAHFRLHPRMDAPLPEDISEDRPHIAFTPYLQTADGRVLLTGSRIRSIALVLSMIT